VPVELQLLLVVQVAVVEQQEIKVLRVLAALVDQQAHRDLVDLVVLL
jgi:hypothetical protein